MATYFSFSLAYQLILLFSSITSNALTEHVLDVTRRITGKIVLTIKSSGFVIFSPRSWRPCSVLNGPSLWKVTFHSLKKRSMSRYFLSFRYSRNTSMAWVSSSAKKKKIQFVTFPTYRSHCEIRDFPANFNVKTNHQAPLAIRHQAPLGLRKLEVLYIYSFRWK